MKVSFYVEPSVESVKQTERGVEAAPSVKVMPIYQNPWIIFFGEKGPAAW